jgi:hypothetical protein
MTSLELKWDVSRMCRRGEGREHVDAAFQRRDTAVREELAVHFPPELSGLVMDYLCIVLPRDAPLLYLDFRGNNNGGWCTVAPPVALLTRKLMAVITHCPTIQSMDIVDKRYKLTTEGPTGQSAVLTCISASFDGTPEGVYYACGFPISGVLVRRQILGCHLFGFQTLEPPPDVRNTVGTGRVAFEVERVEFDPKEPDAEAPYAARGIIPAPAFFCHHDDVVGLYDTELIRVVADEPNVGDKRKRT